MQGVPTTQRPQQLQLVNATGCTVDGEDSTVCLVFVDCMWELLFVVIHCGAALHCLVRIALNTNPRVAPLIYDLADLATNTKLPAARPQDHAVGWCDLGPTELVVHSGS